MESEYKLFRIKNKVWHFARVTVEAEPKQAGMEVSDEIREPHVRDQGEVSRKYYADWIDAAVQGAQWCAGALVRQGQVSGCRIVIVRVVGANVDTSAEDVSCAAALATWQALNPGAILPAFDFIDGKWHIQFD